MTVISDQAIETAIPPPPEPLEDEGVSPPKGGERLRMLRSSIGWAAVGGAIIVGLWQLAAWRSPDLPSPADGFSELWTRVSDPFYDNGPNDKGVGRQLAISLQRVFTGFTLAAIVGVPLGLLLGASKRAWKAGNPVVQILRPVSPLAWFPILLVVTKDTGKAAVFVIFVTGLWPIVVNTAAGVATVPRDHRNVARVFCFGRTAYVRHVLIPDSLPSIITGLRLSMGIGWMVIVAAEMLSGGAGIGFFVWDSYNASNLSAVIAAIMLIGVVGLLLDTAFLRLAKRVAIEEVQA